MQHVNIYVVYLNPLERPGVSFLLQTTKERSTQNTDNMNILTVCILLCVAACVSLHPVSLHPPPFCNGLECPRFTLKKNTSEYQERCYEDYKWASTNVAGYEYEEAVRIGFMRLFDYIEGANNKSVKIPMTAPVLVHIQPGPGPYCKNDFTVNFFVPFDLQAKPIPPTSKDIFISNMPAMCAYVKTYGGFSNIDKILENAKKLAEDLENDHLGDAYHKEFYFYAGYDSPFKLFGRTNDIWFIRK